MGKLVRKLATFGREISMKINKGCGKKIEKEMCKRVNKEIGNEI